MILRRAANQSGMLDEQVDQNRQALGQLGRVVDLWIETHPAIRFEAEQEMMRPRALRRRQLRRYGMGTHHCLVVRAPGVASLGRRRLGCPTFTDATRRFLGTGRTSRRASVIRTSSECGMRTAPLVGRATLISPRRAI